MARAGAHLSAGRLEEAEGVYRAILNIDPAEFRAHLGLADCAAGRGCLDDAVEGLTDGSARYAEAGSMRAAFALMTKALAIAPSRLDLHIDVAELEAADGRAKMAALRLENLARTYLAAGQQDEAELVLQAAAAFSAAAATPPPGPASRPFVNPHTGHVTAPPVPRAAATPPPPPPASSSPVMLARVPLQPAPTPMHDMVRPSPLLNNTQTPPPIPASASARKSKRSTRGVATTVAPKWRPSTVTVDPPPRRTKAKRARKASAPGRKAAAPPPLPSQLSRLHTVSGSKPKNGPAASDGAKMSPPRPPSRGPVQRRVAAPPVPPRRNDDDRLMISRLPTPASA